MLNNKKVQGFTLIEILVVISIVGLLSSVFLVGLSGFRSRGRDARRLADLKSVQNGAEIYYTRCGRYAGGVPPASGACPATDITTWAALKTALIDPTLGITKLPDDPLAGQTYYYAGKPADGQSYIIGAKLENAGDQSLTTDVDGTVFGIDCADPVYCVQF